MPDLSLYRVGVVESLEDCPSPPKSGKLLRACRIRIGNDDNDEPILLTVVTSAPNVRIGSRVAVAPVGSAVELDDGSSMTLQKTTVGGVVSEGMLCDSRMLGWTGGAAGVAVQIPDSMEIGACPPNEKPRAKFESEEVVALPAVEVKPLFEKKLTKEEKKKLAEEKRKSKKAAKEAANG